MDKMQSLEAFYRFVNRHKTTEHVSNEMLQQFAREFNYSLVMADINTIAERVLQAYNLYKGKSYVLSDLVKTPSGVELKQIKHIIWFILRYKYQFRLETIADAFYVTHATVLYGINKISKFISFYDEYYLLVSFLLTRLKK